MSMEDWSPHDKYVSIPRLQAGAVGLDCPEGESCVAWPRSRVAELFDVAVAVRDNHPENIAEDLTGDERLQVINRQIKAVHAAQLLEKLMKYMPEAELDPLVVPGVEAFLAGLAEPGGSD